MVQPTSATTTSSGMLNPGGNDQVLRRRISRVAIQELHQEEEQQQSKGEQMSSTVDKIERGIRKYSTFISKDGSNVQMMDDPALGQDC